MGNNFHFLDPTVATSSGLYNSYSLNISYTEFLLSVGMLGLFPGTEH